MENIQQELLKKLSDESSINEIQSYIKKVMEVRGFNKEKSSDKILLLVEEVGELAKAPPYFLYTFIYSSISSAVLGNLSPKILLVPSS